MHANPSDKLVMMANQIAKNLAIQGEERAVKEMSTHIRRSWEPRMLNAMHTYIQADGSALDPLALKGLQAIWPDVKPGKATAVATAPAAAKVADNAPASTKPAKKTAAKRVK
jgi:formate dehydrogenase subunit delta